MKASITFCASGYFTQTVEITKAGYTLAELQADLNSGKVWTTIEKNGDLEIVETGEVVGKVLNVDNHCEYDEFVVE
jgi:hypothetical protein